MSDSSARPRAIPSLLASVALVLAIAACGSSASTDTGSGSDTSVADDSMTDDSMEDDPMEDDSMEDQGGDNDHGAMIEVPDGMAVPAIAITTAADSVSGTNLFVELDDFTIAPEHASTEPIDGEGHLHLYIDGERVLRFYNTALQLTGLDPGEHEISVEVSANNHSAYAVDGVPIRATENVIVSETEHSHDAHDTIEVDAASAPEVGLTVTDDPKSGWNLHVDLTNFTLRPDKVGGQELAGEGHLHLYVDGERITRLYGPWWHLAELTEGSHEIVVELSGNSHSVYTLDGTPITASVTLDVPADRASAEVADDGDHTEMDAMEDAAHGTTIEASVSGGSVATAAERVAVELGSMVTIRVDADTTDEVHVHGYDLTTRVTPAVPAELAFVADIPGVFEVELEGAGALLFEIAVG